MDRLKKRYRALLDQAKGRTVLAEAQSGRERGLARVAQLREHFVESGDIRAQVRAFIQEVFGSGSEAAVAWRNFEHASDADLKSMVEDLSILEELGKDDPSSPQA